MYFSDTYEGARSARTGDLPGIRKVIQPLEDSGVLIHRNIEEVYFSVSLNISYVKVCKLVIFSHLSYLTSNTLTYIVMMFLNIIIIFSFSSSWVRL